MNPLNFAITFACYNQLDYTRQCVDSMVKHGLDLKRLVVIDNGSTDNSRAYLETLDLGGRIFNQANLGCGVAWNQGALALQAEWTIIMNNDVIASKGWIENLIRTAEQHHLKIISPALIEGELDYNFDAFASEATTKMHAVLREGVAHAVCLAVHQSVWLDIGYFQPVPKLLGYEDTLFFHEAQKAGIAMGITGSAWLHHYGSVTQTAMKQERGLAQKDGLGYRYNYRLLQQSWLARKLKKIKKRRQEKLWHTQELAQYGMTLHGVRDNGHFVWTPF
jgi:GT2 family glycosyltransferase